MSGKTAVVTGGAGGIGLAISEELLKSNLVQVWPFVIHPKKKKLLIL